MYNYSLKVSLVTLLSIISFAAKAQLTNHVLLNSYTIEELIEIRTALGVPEFFISVDYPVDVYKLTYETPDAQGNLTIATGALCIPQGVECAPPLASYQHGTVARKTAVPSYMSSELDLGLMLAAAGYVLALPDYLGLGDSPGMHPYVHAETQGTACLDMLRAVRNLQEEIDFIMNDQLMLLGYSQGGHATMALHKEIEENAADEFEVTISIPMSGPYDVSGVQADVIVSDLVYPTPGYLPYVLIGYQSVYGNLYNDVSEVFKPPYDETIPPLFDGTYSMGYINSQCPSIPNRILHDTTLENFRNDPNHRFRKVLARNDLYQWLPKAPVHMLYCEGDDQVNYMNSVVALAEFEANGLTNVEARNLGDGDHSECFTPALFTCKTLMDAAKIVDSGIEVTADVSNEMGTISVTLAGGYPPFSYEWSNGGNTAAISDLEPGVYTLTVTDDNGCQDLFIYEIEDPNAILNLVTTNSLDLFPNPNQVGAQSKILLPDHHQSAQLIIYDASGEIIFKENKINAKTYELPRIHQKGIYLISLKVGKDVYATKWFNH